MPRCYFQFGSHLSSDLGRCLLLGGSVQVSVNDRDCGTLWTPHSGSEEAETLGPVGYLVPRVILSLFSEEVGMCCIYMPGCCSPLQPARPC